MCVTTIESIPILTIIPNLYLKLVFVSELGEDVRDDH